MDTITHVQSLAAFGPLEISLVVAIVLLLFGGRKIPELMKGLGKGMSEFKKARSESEEDTVEEPSNISGKDKSEIEK